MSDEEKQSLPDGVDLLSDGTYRIKLDSPLTSPDGEVKILRIRKIRIGDVVKMRRRIITMGKEINEVELLVLLASLLAGLDIEQAEEISVDDWVRVQEVIAPMLKKSMAGL